MDEVDVLWRMRVAIPGLSAKPWKVTLRQGKEASDDVDASRSGAPY
jgi:hypothetical protein